MILLVSFEGGSMYAHIAASEPYFLITNNMLSYPVAEGGRKDRRGFASMDPAKQREIASRGGRAAHEKGTAHEFTSEEARAAGKKGGEARRRS